MMMMMIPNWRWSVNPDWTRWRGRSWRWPRSVIVFGRSVWQSPSVASYVDALHCAKKQCQLRIEEGWKRSIWRWERDIPSVAVHGLQRIIEIVLGLKVLMSSHRLVVCTVHVDGSGWSHGMNRGCELGFRSQMYLLEVWGLRLESEEWYGGGWWLIVVNRWFGC